MEHLNIMNWAGSTMQLAGSIHLAENSVVVEGGSGLVLDQRGVWPYLWSDHSGDWLYLVPSKPGETIRFYDYSSDSYR